MVCACALQTGLCVQFAAEINNEPLKHLKLGAKPIFSPTRYTAAGADLGNVLSRLSEARNVPWQTPRTAVTYI